MPFNVSVHRIEDDAFFKSPPDVDSVEFDAWLAECGRRWLLFDAFGSDGEVGACWRIPAHALGLPLLSAVYDDGLEVQGAALVELGGELDALERYWTAEPLPDRCDLTRLRERAVVLRGAIRIAQENQGVLGIS